MLCSLCHENESVMFVEQTNVSPKKRMNICLECAKQFGVMPNSKVKEKSLAALYEAFLRYGTVEEVEKKSPDKSKLCPVCGISLFQIKKNQTVGCSECYEVFKKELSSIFKNIGVTTKYSGSMPKRLSKFNSVLTSRIAIQGKLEESLKHEDYEKAAVYRDYLRALEKTAVSGGDDE